MYEGPEPPRDEAVLSESFSPGQRETRVLVLALPFVCHLRQVSAPLWGLILHSNMVGVGMWPEILCNAVFFDAMATKEFKQLLGVAYD